MKKLVLASAISMGLLSLSASAGDKLFGSVTKADLVEAFEKEGHTIDKKFISITGGNIKRLGQYNAVVRLHREVTFDFPFEVIAQAN